MAENDNTTPTPDTPTPDEGPVHEDRLKAWTMQLVDGTALDALDPAPATERERAVAAALKADIEKIQAEGKVVDIPAELPGYE